jgi:plastocyanin
MKTKNRSSATLRTALLVCVGIGVLNGCKVDSATKKAESMDKSTTPGAQTVYPSRSLGSGSMAPASHGTVSGSVLFEGKAPAKILIDTSMDPACAMGSSGPVYTEQYVVNNGKLANVFVYVKSGPPAAMQMGQAGAEPVVMDQKGCQYVPHVIGVAQGGSVMFKNSDVTMHNIHTMPTVVGNQTIDISQGPRGTPVSKQFMKPELMIPVRCNNHPWMNAFINVSATPFFAVTDANGKFTLGGLPPGDYVIGAVHEKLGEQDVPVTVAKDGTVKTDFKFSLKN